ncbi:muscarinic acetylcholine receptor M3-like [Scleropages formosus]|nr:muscarinic acetylcholine receptor M3-like [Scleropages formosus]
MNVSYNSTNGSLHRNYDGPETEGSLVTCIIPGLQQSGLDNNSFLNKNISVTHLYNGTVTPTVLYDPLGGHNIWQVVLIVFFTGLLSLVTIIGNILVLVSFKVNKQLKTVNNYFLLSLAFADLIIGVSSMNLYTTYIIMDQWALGNWACDLWLAIDYVASNASVMNLLVISFDRYFSITRPLTYRAKRTTKRAGIMIGLAWLISFVLWAPAILFWQYFVGERTVPPDKCYIQFLTEPIITFCTAIAAFYLPVTIMTVLYWRIYKETENRSRELAGLQASGSRAERARFIRQSGSSRSCGSFETNQPAPGKRAGRGGESRFRFWSVIKSWGQGCEGEPEHSISDSWNNNEAGASVEHSGSSDEDELPESRAIFSIVLGLPGLQAAAASQLVSVEGLEQDSGEDTGSLGGTSKAENHSYHQCFSKMPTLSMSALGSASRGAIATKSPSAPISLKDAALAKRFATKARNQMTKRKRMSLVKEKKAAQTLSAILFAFIITWTPYNIMVLVNTFCNDCIPQTLWALGYWLCYVNSTVNPMCYALCNKTFRNTFKMILLCQWDKRSRSRQHFQQRQAVVFHRRITRDNL